MTSPSTDRQSLRSPYWIPSSSSNSLSHDHIADALYQSPDNGETLVFSKLDLTDVSVDAAEELATRVDPNGEGMVKRIALGNNRLTTLPTELALLTRLRYLNLKHNSFSTFPRALTLIHSLDTLDISHNKIRRLPNEPGSLVNLRVFCFSRNKISRLPTYLTQFRNLEVLRVDRNPMEWPPKAVMKCSASDDPDLMKDWVHSLQGWIEGEATRDVTQASHYHEKFAFDKISDDATQSHTFDGDHEDASYHGRSYSMDSNTSLTSITESLHESSSPDASLPNKPPPLHIGILQSSSAEPSPVHSFRDEMSPSFDYDLEIPSTFEQMQTFDPPILHTRTASYAEGLRQPTTPMLYSKKSLPDLRKAREPITEPIPTPSHRAVFHFTESNTDEATFPHSSSPPISTGPKLLAPSSLSDASDFTPAVSPHERITSVATERNSYFRRLSVFPLPHILPQHLIDLVESARSLLFAMCQIYQSLEQYAALVVDDRFSVVLRKVLDPAHSDMMHFIEALEHFDSMSRTSMPPPSVSRTLVERCRDCAAAFGKAVNMLLLRLKVDPGEDLRFSRWMLLEMYAATAEIAGAWNSMQSHVNTMNSYLRTQDPIDPSHGQESIPAVEKLSQHTLRVGISGRNRTTRRHAGSFSSKDVEIGKKLPSFDLPSSRTGGVLVGPAPYIPMLRTPKRQATAPALSSTKASWPIPLWHQNPSDERFDHVRHGSNKSISYFSPSSSPSLTAKPLDHSTSSRRKVDFEALNAIQSAVEAAPKVWDMVADMMLENSPQDVQEARVTLQQARSVTKKLSDIIIKIHTGDITSEKRLLQDDAQLFLRVVVKISSFVKNHSVNHSVPYALRSSIVRLTKMTEEFAILLHVSSFTPSTPRSYSPMLMHPTSLGDGRLTSNLSRAKSAHSPTIKIPHPALSDGPRSALPNHSFRLPDVIPTSSLNRRPNNSGRETANADDAE